MITEDQYVSLARAELGFMLAALDEVDPDELSVELENDILTLEFADGAKYILNSHRAARQLWLAAELSAYHFSWNGSAWIAEKTGDELWATMDRVVRGKVPTAPKLEGKGAGA